MVSAARLYAVAFVSGDQYIQKPVQFIIVDALPRYARFECPHGETTFSIHRVKDLRKGEGITIYFEDDDLDELVNQSIEVNEWVSVKV